MTDIKDMDYFRGSAERLVREGCDYFEAVEAVYRGYELRAEEVYLRSEGKDKELAKRLLRFGFSACCRLLEEADY